jgi:phosphoserine phosphatase RsbU/P
MPFFLAELDGLTLLVGALFLAAATLVGVLRRQLTAQQRKLDELQERVDFAARRRRAAMELFNTFGSAFESSISLENLLRSILAFFMRVAQASGGAAYLVDPRSQKLHLQARCGTLGASFGPDSKVMPLVIEPGMGVLGEASASGRALVINDAATARRLNAITSSSVTLHNALVVPLRFRNHNLGLMLVVNHITEDGTVNKPFGRFEFQLIEAMALYAATAVHLTLSYLEQSEKQRLDFDLGVAVEIQQLLLPQTAPVAPGFLISGNSRPAYRVGGDYFDFIPLPEDRLALVMADVSGKGVNGALLMAICRTVVRNVAPRFSEPADAVREFRRRLLPDLPEDKFITLTYGVLDLRQRRFAFARAGHDPLLHYCKATGSAHLHSPKGGAIGLDRSDRFDRTLEEDTLDLATGDVLLLFTDGVTDTTNPEGAEFGINQLRGLVEEHASRTAEELGKTVLQRVSEFARGEPVADDQTLLVVKGV